MVYWLVSLQLHNKRKDAVWELLQERTSASMLCTNFKLDIPGLRVGTLDSLMALSDELSKSSTMIEAVLAKVKRQVNESGGAKAMAALTVEGVSTDLYVQRFHWDDAKFPTRRLLKDMVDKITELVSRIDDDLKVKVSELNNLKSQMSQVTRKAQGSLAVRDVATVVKPHHIIDTEHLATVFVVVSKFALRDWEDSYTKMANFVVPRSSTTVAEDNDYALVTVVLFKRVIDDFKAAARTKGYQVREYNPPAEGAELSLAQIEQLKHDMEQKKTDVEQWCKTAYSEVFSCYMHMLVVQLFVESILRYGLPPNFQAAVVRPQDKAEGRLRAELEATFGSGKTHYWRDDGSSLGAGLVGDAELHPYVSLTVNMDLAAGYA
ncbi:vacuolar ATP synthase, subunit C [Volvox carteri f. nagariensis]|uniref:V-type proton ATPase subunit C n=1 Tax=Volvox carteri f. nagariensis TaxID=3068 RepID=D8U749_VOLCA|nr:vacuolar ATP synthase, subunit C [Volvox carteri f. nagariensis]ADI46857.1 ATPvC1f [Volvox carteri f. nagariensis]EFJ44420.1 vacuolar ATP synthase, subunit C [Volvox carteri f. nagariensis]|eukprot:XP_002954527.1 vacuolar ATP synthase, subunit C [Volvox carteri f. nagariensis]